MNRAYRLVSEHFSRLAKLDKWPFLWRSWIEATAIAYVIGNAIQMVLPAASRADLRGFTVFHLVALVAIIGPLFETIVFQCLSLELSAALGFRRWVRMALSVIPFALMHRFAGVPAVIAAGAVGGCRNIRSPTSSKANGLREARSTKAGKMRRLSASDIHAQADRGGQPDRDGNWRRRGFVLGV
jgi:hypothetical protein